MGKRERRIERLIDWLMEASVLLAILPVVDELVRAGTIDPLVVALPWLGAGATFLAGLYLLERS